MGGGGVSNEELAILVQADPKNRRDSLMELWAQTRARKPAGGNTGPVLGHREAGRERGTKGLEIPATSPHIYGTEGVFVDLPKIGEVSRFGLSLIFRRLEAMSFLTSLAVNINHRQSDGA